MLIRKELCTKRDSLIDYIDFLKSRGLSYHDEQLELEKLELELIELDSYRKDLL